MVSNIYHIVSNVKLNIPYEIVIPVKSPYSCKYSKSFFRTSRVKYELYEPITIQHRNNRWYFIRILRITNIKLCQNKWMNGLYSFITPTSSRVDDAENYGTTSEQTLWLIRLRVTLYLRFRNRVIFTAIPMKGTMVYLT